MSSGLRYYKNYRTCLLVLANCGIAEVEAQLHTHHISNYYIILLNYSCLIIIAY